MANIMCASETRSGLAAVAQLRHFLPLPLRSIFPVLHGKQCSFIEAKTMNNNMNNVAPPQVVSI